MDIMTYIKPELLILIPVLYLIGIMLKKAEFITDKYIPLILGGISIILCAIYLVSTIPASFVFTAEMVFTSITQGIICAGLSTYANQLFKQLTKDGE